MCASCVSQGALYLGGSLATLRVMAHRAGRRRGMGDEPSEVEAAAVGLLLAAALAGCGDDGDGLAERQAEVARRGAEVMPFDLDATTHTFRPTPDGGEQVVTADDPGDREQVELVRGHLREERDAFSQGDFSDPAAIHGHDMPGVAELQAGFRDINVTYEDVPGGARLTYRAEQPELVAAVHAWFERQVVDHGAHAQHG